MAKRTYHSSNVGHGNRFKRPSFIAEPDRDAFEKFCPDCAWDDCHRPRFFDMPVCQGHALIIYGRVVGARQVLAPQRAPRQELSPEPYVYYLMRSPVVVKIGTTIDIKRRMRSLYAELQYVVAIEPGGTDLEKQRHKEFAAERIGQREEFALSDRLKKHIESLLPQRDELMAIATTDPARRTKTTASI